jgi:hypothetical protein
MQRVCSILALIAVLCPVATPLWASATTMPNGMSCHRVPMGTATTADPVHSPHHCHEMEAEQATIPEQGDNATIASAASLEKCPMNCCLQSAPPTVAALPMASGLPLLYATEFKMHSVAVIFSSPGFSSHTDRGPPSLRA